MKLLIIALSALILSSCGTLRDNSNTHLIISCAEASGLGSLLAGGGTTRKMTHSDPQHVFTDRELDLFDRKCPTAVTEDALLNLLIQERLAGV